MINKNTTLLWDYLWQWQNCWVNSNWHCARPIQVSIC